MAFNLAVPDFVIDASIDCCNKGNMGNRGNGSDGTKEQQLVGIIGQNMVNLMMGKPMLQPGGGFDGGVDCNLFGMDFDIKTMGRTVAPRLEFVNNFIRSQAKYKVDGYIFQSLNKETNVLTVCGWLPKAMFEERATLYMKGDQRIRTNGTSFELKADTYEIPNELLFYRSNNWQELMAEICLYA